MRQHGDFPLDGIRFRAGPESPCRPKRSKNDGRCQDGSSLKQDRPEQTGYRENTRDPRHGARAGCQIVAAGYHLLGRKPEASRRTFRDAQERRKRPAGQDRAHRQCRERCRRPVLTRRPVRCWALHALERLGEHLAGKSGRGRNGLRSSQARDGRGDCATRCSGFDSRTADHAKREACNRCASNPQRLRRRSGRSNLERDHSRHDADRRRDSGLLAGCAKNRRDRAIHPGRVATRGVRDTCFLAS